MFTPGEGDVTNCTFDIFWNTKVKVTDLNTSSGIIRVDNCNDLLFRCTTACRRSFLNKKSGSEIN